MAGDLRKHRAFTLLELLVAMALMVVVAACLYTVLYTSFRARRSALLAVEPTALAINAIELIKQDAYGVLPPTGTLAGAFLGTDSRGINGVNADSLEFYTTHIYADGGNLVGGLGKVELILDQDTDDDRGSYRLVRKVTTNLLSPRAVESDEQVLCRNVMSLNLRYFNGDGWLTEWDSTAETNSLPLAMEIDIQLLHSATNSAAEPQRRRLTQSFPIPCGGTTEQESQSESDGTGAGGSQTGI
jgi:prepilin-type N-terminal cleavage/methylation domain-containing protein